MPKSLSLSDQVEIIGNNSMSYWTFLVMYTMVSISARVGRDLKLPKHTHMYTLWNQIKSALDCVLRLFWTIQFTQVITHEGNPTGTK